VATKADFSEDEWEALHKGATGAGLMVSVGDRDFTDTFGEAGALAKQMREAHEQSTSELVRELAGTRGSGFGFTTSPEKAEAETLEALRTGKAALAAKAPEEQAAYREFVLGVANAVATAKGDVSGSESAVIEKITAALDAG
jgi:tellurite resistance protein